MQQQNGVEWEQVRIDLWRQKLEEQERAVAAHVGIPVLALGVAIGAGLAWCRIGTSEPHFRRGPIL